MPQEFCALRCFSCNSFQVHIVKKSSKKWSCKLCGEKQTIIKIYGQGSAQDCREHVQKLNMIRGMSSEIQDQALSESSNTETMQQENTAKIAELGSAGIGQLPQDSKQPSKWSCFLDPEDDN